MTFFEMTRNRRHALGNAPALDACVELHSVTATDAMDADKALSEADDAATVDRLTAELATARYRAARRLSEVA